MFSLIYSRTNDWVNNRDTGDLRRHRAHYDVTVMCNAPTMYINFSTTLYLVHLKDGLSEVDRIYFIQPT